jgi:hypothetical protein
LGSEGLRVGWTLGWGVVGLGLCDGVERLGGDVSCHGGLGVVAIVGGLHGGFE